MIWTESAKPEDTTGDLENRLWAAANQLWAAANQLWANAALKPSEFSPVVLGLIFLRFADIRFAVVDEKLKPAKGKSSRRKITPASYHAEGVLFLPDESRFATLLDLPEGANLGQAVNDATRAVERDKGSDEKWAEVFGEALAYQDIPGLCKVATRAEIEAQGWSLNPGRYVGVAKGEELSDEDFKERLEALNEELEVLNAEARELEERIAENVAGILEAS